VGDHDAASAADRDAANPVAMLEYREDLVREKWIHIAERLRWMWLFPQSADLDGVACRYSCS
jgi:hypothetical protein